MWVPGHERLLAFYHSFDEKSKNPTWPSEHGGHLAAIPLAMDGSWLSIRGFNRSLSPPSVKNRPHHGVAGTDLKPVDSPRFQTANWLMIHW